MKTKGFMLADALLGLTLMAIVVLTVMESLQNAKGWTEQARSRKNVTEEAERLWLEIQTQQSMGNKSEVADLSWAISSDLNMGGIKMLKLSAASGEEFYVAVPQ